MHRCRSQPMRKQANSFRLSKWQPQPHNVASGACWSLPVLHVLGWEADKAQVTTQRVQLNVPRHNRLALGNLSAQDETYIAAATRLVHEGR